MYDVRRLVLIRDLAEYGTISAVSELHGITSSAVSQQLRALEREVGGALLRREGRVLRLTYAGQVLVRHTSKVLHALEEAESAVAATRDTVSEVLTLIGFGTTLVALAGPLFDRLRRRHPELKLRIVAGKKATALKALRTQEADLALTHHYSFRDPGLPVGVESEFLAADPLVLLAPPESHAGIENDGLRYLADVDWIAADDGTPSLEPLLHHCRPAGFTPRIAHRIHDFPSMAQLVAAGAGVAIIPKFEVPAGLEHLIVQPLAYGTRQISVVYRSGTARRPSVAAVLHALRMVARERKVSERRGGNGRVDDGSRLSDTA